MVPGAVRDRLQGLPRHDDRQSRTSSSRRSATSPSSRTTSHRPATARRPPSASSRPRPSTGTRRRTTRTGRRSRPRPRAPAARSRPARTTTASRRSSAASRATRRRRRARSSPPSGKVTLELDGRRRRDGLQHLPRHGRGRRERRTSRRRGASLVDTGAAAGTTGTPLTKTVQSALEALSLIGYGNVEVKKAGGTYRVHFQGQLGGTAIALLGSDPTAAPERRRRRRQAQRRRLRAHRPTALGAADVDLADRPRACRR